MNKTVKLVLKIVACVLMVVLSVAFIVGDYFAWQYSLNVDALLGVTKTDFSGAAAELQASDKLSVELEEDAITLLKNENDTLPLADDVTNLNVFGYGATDNGFLIRGVGSGSSTINSSKKITLVQALEGYVRDFDVEDLLTDGANKEEVKEQWGKDHLVSFNVNKDILAKYNSLSGTRPSSPSSSNVYNLNEPDTSVFESIIGEAVTFSDVALFVVSRDGGENVGEIPDGYLDLSAKERTTIKYLNDYFEKVIIILNTTNTMHMGWLDDAELGIDACIYVGLTGQSGARAIPEILRGKKFVEEEVTDENGSVSTKISEIEFSPSGRFSDIVTKSSAMVAKWDPTYANRKPGQNGANGIAYIDDIYYGYKWYETADYDKFEKTDGSEFVYNDVVQYPFGYGLSYTSFEKKITSVTYGKNNTKLDKNADFSGLDAGEEITVKVEVKNTGSKAGSEVVQLYYTPEYNGTIEKAHVNLLDFGKTSILKPNGTETVTLTFTPYDMASYDCYDKDGNGFWGYELEEGKYELKLMDNSHDLLETYALTCKNTVNIDKDPVTEESVVNRFTGKQDGWENYNGSSFAGLGTDAYEAGASRDVWFTRANFAGTFPTGGLKNLNTTKVNNANKYYADDDWTVKLPDYVGDSNVTDSDLRLVRIANYDMPVSDIPKGEEEAHLVSIEVATSNDQLNKLKNNQKLAYDWDLIETLAKDYNAAEWDLLLNQLKLSDMKRLIEVGAFRRLALVDIGKPQQNDCDGPAGFNTASITGNWTGESDTEQWTAYESEALIGCCWNKGLLLAMGLSMGAEAQVTGVGGWYAPGVNLHRSNYTARNYEYYSEDGVLSGKLAAYVIAGAKINNLNCYIKHFACSEEGPNPGGVNTWLTEQNLRENYLRPFEIAVKEGGVNSLMTAFNNVGSTWAGANYAMNVAVLRGEWGFRGSVITDWTNGAGEGGMYSRQGVRAGNDLWLNNQESLGGALDTSNNASHGSDAKYIRNSMHNILYTYVDTLYNYKMYQEYMNGEEVEGLEVDGELATLLAKYGIGELQSGARKEGYSWWKPTLIVIEVVLILGMITGALFMWGVPQMLIKKIKGNKATAGGDGALADNDGSLYPSPEEGTAGIEPTAPEDTPKE